MSRRASLSTAGASYLQFATIALTGLISAPLAYRFLGQERLGLWSFTTQSLGYFLLLDLGVTASVGRLMGEPIHGDDPKECSRWFTLFFVVLSLQSLLMLGAGYLLLDSVLNWFAIAPDLRPEARALWLMMLVVNALAFPLRVAIGILFAQNRYYWVLLTGALGQWIGLLAFFLFLKRGAGSLAYAYSTIAAMVLSYGLQWLAVKLGPQKFKLALSNIRWKDLGSLFNYSSSVFIIGLTVQIVFLSQTLVVTKILGLSAVALFTMSSKTAQLGMQLIWRSFDALNPRWQQLYVAGEKNHLAASFQRYTGLTMSLALAGSTLMVVLNRPFVETWMGPKLYAGKHFDLLLALYVLQHTWNHCLAFCVLVAKAMRSLTILAFLEMALNIGLSVALAHKFGVNGVLAGGILGSIVTTIYLTLKAPPYVFLSLRELVRPSILSWLALATCATMASIWVHLTPAGEQKLWIRGLFCVLAAITFVVLNRDDLREFVARAKGRL